MAGSDASDDLVPAATACAGAAARANTHGGRRVTTATTGYTASVNASSIPDRTST